eukprot:1841547-Prymnesium_polylepis.1
MLATDATGSEVNMRALAPHTDHARLKRLAASTPGWHSASKPSKDMAAPRSCVRLARGFFRACSAAECVSTGRVDVDSSIWG